VRVTTAQLDKSGGIVVGGMSDPIQGAPVLARYLANGTLDSSFAVGGISFISSIDGEDITGAMSFDLEGYGKCCSAAQLWTVRVC
jgi:hypothetical protein